MAEQPPSRAVHNLIALSGLEHAKTSREMDGQMWLAIYDATHSLGMIRVDQSFELIQRDFQELLRDHGRT